MPYTWTGASTLGFDLSRWAGGPEVAAVLVAALSAGPDQVTALAARPAPPQSLRLDVLARAEAAVATTVLDLRRLDDLAADADLMTRVGVIRERLRAQRFGGPADLVDLVERDGLTHLAGEVPDDVLAAAGARLSDAALAAFLAHTGGDDASLAAPLATAFAGCRRKPERRDLGPYPTAVRGVLDDILTGGTSDPRRLRAPAVDPDLLWSAAMHAASWAVELTGRTRAFATGQLLCVIALAEAGFTADDCAAGVWNAASGLVLAPLVADILPGAELAVIAPGG